MDIFMLFTNSFQPFQGRFRRIYNEARTLIEDGHRVTVLAWDRECKYPREEMTEGVKVRRFWIKSGERRGPIIIFQMMRFWWQMYFYLRNLKVDVVHCHNLDVLLPGYFIARRKKAKVILDVCEPEYYTYWSPIYYPLYLATRWIEKFFSRRVDCCLVHNEYQIHKYRRMGVRRIKLVGSYPPRPRGVVKRKSGKKEVVIGRIGSIYHNNGIEELVEAFKSLSLSHPEVRLLLAGRVFDTYKKTFENLIRELGGKVEVYGAFPSSEMGKFYRKIDISVMLYRVDRWFRNITPTKFFDSLAFGVPVVISNIGGVKNIIKKNPCGVVVEKLEPKSIEKALLQLINSPQLRGEMVENGLRLAREKYNWEIMAERLKRVYRLL